MQRAQKHRVETTSRQSQPTAFVPKKAGSEGGPSNPLTQMVDLLNKAPASVQLQTLAKQVNSPQSLAGDGNIGQLAEQRTSHGQMPDQLRSGLERLSGLDLSSVRVNYNSSKPAQLNAHAYAQGNTIEVAPGQQQHLPHEGWHVVQQMQGRVRPTASSNGIPINDDPSLEAEADSMGRRALNVGGGTAGVQCVAITQSVAQLQQYSLQQIMAAVGGDFEETGGGSQVSSSGRTSSIQGLEYHFSIRQASPADMHISYYRAGSVDTKDKVLDFRYQWNAEQEQWGPQGMILGKIWKAYVGQLAELKQEGQQLAAQLQQRLRGILNPPPPPLEVAEDESDEDVPVPQVEQQEAEDYIPLPQVDEDEMVDVDPNLRYFEQPVLKKSKVPSNAVQRQVTVNAQGEAADDLQGALDAVMLQAPLPIQQAYQILQQSQQINLILDFQDMDDGFGHTIVNGSNIWVLANSNMMQVDEEPEEGDNEISETELQATLIHEFVLHVMPALAALQANNYDPAVNTEAAEHASLAGWTTVLNTAATVNPYVHLNSIVDALLHRHHLAPADREGLDAILNGIHGLEMFHEPGMPWLVQLGGEEGPYRMLDFAGGVWTSAEEDSSEDSGESEISAEEEEVAAQENPHGG